MIESDRFYNQYLVESIIIFNLSHSGFNELCQKICKHFKFDLTDRPFYNPLFSYSQVVLQPYRTELPDFLISIIDSLMKIDTQQVFLHCQELQQLDALLNQIEEFPNLVWLFIDTLQPSNHIIYTNDTSFDLKASKSMKSQSQTLSMNVSEAQSKHGITFVCNNILANKLSEDQFKFINLIKVKSLEHIRLKCEANLYTNPIDFESDVRGIFSWSQVYRAQSLKSFQYISLIFEKFIQLLQKKDFFVKFFEKKYDDLTRLSLYQAQFKVSCQKWPIVPTSFRQYEEIDRYQSAPAYRAPIINQRLLSKKEPVQCPENCVCYSSSLDNSKQFCNYSLLNGWQSECPNRTRKVQCNHLDQQKMRLCRNCEIKKKQRKRCQGKISSQGQQSQIQQRLAWGIDLFTRHVLFHCLPQIQITQNLQKVSNLEKKNLFIEHSLTKAMNLNGPLGYSLINTCNFIKQHSSKANFQSLENNQENLHQNTQMKQQNEYEGLFTSTDYDYADLLIKNYELAPDKNIFRFHTKGKGAICIDKKGIQKGSFIIEYFGQIYEPWRWFDKQDFIKQVLKKRKLKNFIPQFYNIVLEKHADEPLGYDTLVIDPSRKGNFSSRFSHSCDPNCGTVITVSNGKYYIGMYSFKNIEYGEQLTFDYCSMTESSYQHYNSICLCGMEKCRGYYLQLSNNKIFNSLMDNKNCFFTRNSAILKSSGPVTEQQFKICAENNIKQGMLQGTSDWLIKWMAQILQFIQYQGQVYKQSLIEQWNKVYPWDNSQSQQQKLRKIQLYSQTNKSDLISIRFQNLTTSVDKIKYFFSRNQANQSPPIYIEQNKKVVQVLITKPDSILLELQQNLIKYKSEALANMVQGFIQQIQKNKQLEDKLFLFRLCCITISHNLLLQKTNTFNNELLSDILFFYAFTHTYFSPNNYKTFEADEITVSLSQILGQKSTPNQKKQKSRKKYASPFVWGQMASWFKQTVVCPQASLSQDRRGTLSYPLVSSIMQSQYPYEKQSRAQFLKMILEKPATSWPPAIGCDLSFKNPFKLYGTLLFENIHNQDKFANKLPCQTLLQSCMNVIKSTFRNKIQLFKTVQWIMYKREKQSISYKVINIYKMNWDEQPMISNPNGFNLKSVGQPRKRLKKQQQDSL